MSDSIVAGTTAGLASKRMGRSVYSPFWDFVLLGGGSLLVLPLIALVPGSYAPSVLLVTFWLSFAINYPHFAHSYQIFYRNFRRKLMGGEYPTHLRLRYAFAGIAVPVIIAAIFWLCYWSGNNKLMGACASAMAFFVGWHYVKQGYGMLIVESVYHRSFFNEAEKLRFRINAYCGWIFSFLLGTERIGSQDYLGLKYYLTEVPMPLLVASGIAFLASTVVTVSAGVSAARRSGKDNIPFNGYVAYVTSIYIWLCQFFTPAVYYVIPAFHSLQYLAIVWRYEYNRNAAALKSADQLASRDTLLVRYSTFIALGMLLGLLGFAWIPRTLDAYIDYNKAVFGSQLFTFMIFIFINIHHYFIDNVIWRKDNADVSRHLFGVA